MMHVAIGRESLADPRVSFAAQRLAVSVHGPNSWFESTGCPTLTFSQMFQIVTILDAIGSVAQPRFRSGGTQLRRHDRCWRLAPNVHFLATTPLPTRSPQHNVSQRVTPTPPVAPSAHWISCPPNANPLVFAFEIARC